MSVIQNNLLMTPEGYQISRSVRLRSSASAYFNRTPASATNRKTWTLSKWFKRGCLPSSGYYSLFGADSGSGSSFYIAFDNSTQQLELGQGATVYRKTSQVFRDPSAFYHVVVASDTTQATASNRLKIYVNGVQVTAFATSNDPSLNGDWAVSNNVAHSIGADIPNTGARNFFDGYLTEVNFIDGQALTPSSFGETDAVTGVWKPKKYAGTYGTNGFYLNFSDNSAATAAAIGKDSSGNGNNWTPNNISVTAGVTYDSMLDVPTPYADGGNGRGNYAVLNSVDGGIARTTISNGNLSALFTASAAGAGIRASGFQMPTSGKWYAEFTLIAKPTLANASTVGISRADTILNATGNWYIGNSANDYGWIWYTGATAKYNNATVGTTYGTAPAVGDVVGVAVDLDTNAGAFTLTFYLNGVSQGAAYSNVSTGGQTFSFGCSGTDSTNFAANFGQRPFAFTPPTGFKALNTQNLPAGSITTSGSFTGNASSDGPFVYLNGVPTAMTINGNAVTFATHVDKTANGFKLRTSSSSYNASGSNTYSITTTGAKFKYANAQVNP